jgi:hypothetical protein
MSNVSFLFIIYSCKKRLNLANQLYDMLNNQLNNSKVYIIYGDNTIDTEYILNDDKYLVLNVGDYYEHLADKTTKLMKIINQIFPNIIGCFKCDDDIIPSINALNASIEYFTHNNIQYAGTIIHNHNIHYSSWHIGKANDNAFNVPLLAYPSICCAGPLYYINKEAIEKFTNIEKDNYMIMEDLYLGYYLNKCNIYPTRLELYTDHIIYKDRVSLHTNNQIGKIYIKLHGGLSNQFIQFASGYGLAKKNNKILICICDDKSFKINNKNLLFIQFENLENNIYTYNDNDNNSNIDVNIQKNIYLNCIFNNELYFSEYKDEIYNLLIKF